MTWRHAAACRDTDPDPDLWFPNAHRTDQAVAAKRVCAGCPVRVECLEANPHEKHGVFGGFSENDRKAERRRRRNLGTAA